MALTSLTNLQPLHVHSVGVSTFDGSVSVGGTLTYEDVTNVDAIGIVTARSGVNVSGGQLDVGSNIKLGNAGVITATSFVGSGANLTNLPSQITITDNSNNRVITGGSGTNLVGETKLIFDGNTLGISGGGSHPFAIGGGDYRSLAISGNTQSSSGFIYLGNGAATTNADFDLGRIRIYNGATQVVQISGSTDTSANDDGRIVLHTRNAGGTLQERLRITSTGQLRTGDESSSDRTGYRHQFSSTAGSGDVLSIQNPSNTDGQGIGLGFWARNTNNAAIEAAKIKAVIDETQANSTQKGSLKFFTNKDASLGERMQINSAGNVRITGSTHSSQGTSAGNVPLQIVGGGNNVVTMFLGNGNTAGNGVNDYSADIRFNGAAVAWGDISYYPTGNSNGGAFRFTGNGSTVSSQGNRSLGCSGVFINGTSQNQHLDDYEEGDYTPNVQTDNGVNCGMAAAQGYYVKVGKIVTVHLRIQTNSHNSVNTSAQYKVSLPFTSQAAGDTQGTLMCSIWSIGSSNISWMGGQVHNNNAWTHLAYHNGNNNNTNNLQPNVAGNQLQFRGTVVYRSDS